MLVGATHREIGFLISTNNTSWGISPNIEGDSNVNLQKCASWPGLNTEIFEKKFYILYLF
ncbi:hypothetical protein C7Q93_07130 [Staphylococcus aureus]|nr:hypothetical protein DDG68_02360 [Staphylococcus aureus]PZH52432.1 hypothetical protein C7Q64_10955 [Staphylococcus aureus]PZI21233.1 hypothetical protein C7Q93_07130 [Staphylococcus aureus]QFK17062.1 hypothetical protein DQU69_07225 [Staphylococcus aureus]QFK65924.1 hypothetical protein DQU79_07350 [Staphylococcus aureus]